MKSSLTLSELFIDKVPHKRLRSKLIPYVVMLPVETTMIVMFHVLLVCCMLFHGSGCRCDYCMFSRSIDTCRRHVMLMMSHYELHDDELALWHSSPSRYDQLRCPAIALWRCLIVSKCL